MPKTSMQMGILRITRRETRMQVGVRMTDIPEKFQRRTFFVFLNWQQRNEGVGENDILV